ncbi:unnamed protein product [Rotaria magnacalcarata]
MTNSVLLNVQSIIELLLLKIFFHQLWCWAMVDIQLLNVLLILLLTAQTTKHRKDSLCECVVQLNLNSFQRSCHVLSKTSDTAYIGLTAWWALIVDAQKVFFINGYKQQALLKKCWMHILKDKYQSIHPPSPTGYKMRGGFYSNGA